MPKKDEVTAFVDTWIAEDYPIGDMQREYRFHPSRRWRFDVAWPSQKIAVEIDGGGYGHQSIAGKKQDNEKQNAATAMGWRVFRFCTGMSSTVRDQAVTQVAEVMCGVIE